MKTTSLFLFYILLSLQNVFSQPYFIRHYGQSQHDASYSITFGAGNLMQAGASTGFSATPNDVYLINTNTSGIINSSYYIDLGGDDCAFGSRYNSITSNFIFTGFTNPHDSVEDDSLCGRDVFLLETDRFGIPVWAKKYGYGLCEDVGKSVLLTDDTNYLVVGYTTYLCDSDSLTCDYHNVLLFKTDLNGNLIWSKSIDISRRDDFGMKAIEANGYYYITGYSDDRNGNPEPFLMQTNTSGTVNWVKFYGDPNYEDEAFSLIDYDNGITVIGHTYGFNSGGNPKVLAFHTDYSGSVIWKAEYFTSNNTRSSFGRDLTPTKDGYFFAGYSDDISSAPNYDIYFIQTDINGNMFNQANFGGDFDDRGYSIVSNKKGAYISGYSYTWTFGLDDAALVHCNTVGEVYDCYQYDAVGTDFLDRNDTNIRFSECDYNYSIDLQYNYRDAGQGELVCGSDSDTIQSPHRIRRSINNEVSIYPELIISPEQLHLKFFANETDYFSLELVNLVGEKVYETNGYANSGWNNVSISIPENLSGMYLVKIMGKNINSVQKIIVQHF